MPLKYDRPVEAILLREELQTRGRKDDGMVGVGGVRNSELQHVQVLRAS